MKTLIKIFLTILLIPTIWSCDIQKESAKQKNDIDLDESFRNISFRKGDSIIYVPNVQLKDTTIYRTTVQGTVLKTVYDQSGQISVIECQSSQIAELTEMNRRLLDQSKTKEQSKDENIGMQFIPLIIGGVVVIFLILVIFLFLYLKSMNKKNDAILQFIQNKL